MKRLIFILLTIMLSSCYADDSTPSPDSRFTGSWNYYNYYVAGDGINETMRNKTYTFDDTNEVYYYSHYKSYSSGSGWTEYTISDYFTWTVNGNQLCLLSTCNTFEFKNGGLQIGEYFYTKR